MMEYRIVTASVMALPIRVHELLTDGWVLLGRPFRTGNKVRRFDDPDYERSCEYDSQVAQAMTRDAVAKKEAKNG